jgi:hypothetical protein
MRFDLLRVVYGREVIQAGFRADLQRHRQDFQQAADTVISDPEIEDSDLHSVTSMGFKIIASLMSVADQGWRGLSPIIGSRSDSPYPSFYVYHPLRARLLAAQGRPDALRS